MPALFESQLPPPRRYINLDALAEEVELQASSLLPHPTRPPSRSLACGRQPVPYLLELSHLYTILALPLQAP